MKYLFCLLIIVAQIFIGAHALACNEVCKDICMRAGGRKECVEACGCKWVPGMLACDEECKLICQRNGGTRSMQPCSKHDQSKISLQVARLALKPAAVKHSSSKLKVIEESEFNKFIISINDPRFRFF